MTTTKACAESNVYAESIYTLGQPDLMGRDGDTRAATAAVQPHVFFVLHFFPSVFSFFRGPEVGVAKGRGGGMPV